MHWKQNRLDEWYFDLSYGYWFAYISSTTIGFGDIYLNPEVLITTDLIIFPMLFLAAFVSIAAFLSKFSAVFGFVFGRRSLVHDLLNNIKTSGPTRQDNNDNMASVTGESSAE